MKVDLRPTSKTSHKQAKLKRLYLFVYIDLNIYIEELELECAICFHEGQKIEWHSLISHLTGCQH